MPLRLFRSRLSAGFRATSLPGFAPLARFAGGGVRRGPRIGWRVLLGGILLAGCGTGCRSLPSLEGRPESVAIEDTASTALGQAVARAAERAASPRGGDAGFVAIPEARDAFAVRALLARAAERSLDLQYYIWRDDLSGSLLLTALREAAERGVRVRLLLDDANLSPKLDLALAALDAHERVEVRLFNPFVGRQFRPWGYLTDFRRLNRRMHNKLFIADNQVAVVGGRNVGDEYFGAGAATGFADLDVMAVGAVVRAASRDFDAYWASDSSYPADRVIGPVDAARSAAAWAGIAAASERPEAADYLAALQGQTLVRRMFAGELPLEWTTIQLVSDSPTKGLGLAGPAERLPDLLRRAVGEPNDELLLVSPYFVPTKAGTEALVALAARGVRVRILTNSLQATDVSAVHAGYAKWRKPLLRAGVSIHELKATARLVETDLALGSSAASLHAKTFVSDRARVFIGSFNLDPRSARFNTEVGVVIDSAATGRSIADFFAAGVDDVAYAVRLDERGRLIWVERRADGERVHRQEPGAGLGRRLLVRVLSWLPLDWLL